LSRKEREGPHDTDSIEQWPVGADVKPMVIEAVLWPR
jgi:hypothetical protein